MVWDQQFPNGRIVFYEGNDPEGFAREMAALGIKVNWMENRSFLIPAGRVDEIYGDSRWPLGS